MRVLVLRNPSSKLKCSAQVKEGAECDLPEAEAKRLESLGLVEVLAPDTPKRQAAKEPPKSGSSNA